MICSRFHRVSGPHYPISLDVHHWFRPRRLFTVTSGTFYSFPVCVCFSLTHVSEVGVSFSEVRFICSSLLSHGSSLPFLGHVNKTLAFLPPFSSRWFIPVVPRQWHQLTSAFGLLVSYCADERWVSVIRQWLYLVNVFACWAGLESVIALYIWYHLRLWLCSNTRHTVWNCMLHMLCMFNTSCSHAFWL